jgi:DNA-binding response OmpR family regulator
MHANNESIGPDPQVILLAEDDRDMRMLLSQALRKQGYMVTECQDGVQFLTRLGPLLDSRGAVEYDVIISDIRMPGLTGMEVLEGLTDTAWCPPVILITAFGDSDTHVRAAELGVAAMFDKPFEIDDLVAAVRAVLA